MTTTKEMRQDIHAAYFEEYAENIRKERKWLRRIENIGHIPSLFEALGIVGGFSAVVIIWPVAAVVAVPVMTVAVTAALVRTIPPAIAGRIVKRAAIKAIDRDIDNGTLPNRYEHDLKKDTQQIEKAIASIETALTDLKLKLQFTSAHSGVEKPAQESAPVVTPPPPPQQL